MPISEVYACCPCNKARCLHHHLRLNKEARATCHKEKSSTTKALMSYRGTFFPGMYWSLVTNVFSDSSDSSLTYVEVVNHLSTSKSSDVYCALLLRFMLVTRGISKQVSTCIASFLRPSFSLVYEKLSGGLGMRLHVVYSQFVNSHFVNSHFFNSHLVLYQFPLRLEIV